MTAAKLGAILFLLLLFFSPACLVLAYDNKPEINVLDSNGYFHFYKINIGIAVSMRGTPGANFTLTPSIYNGNPQPNASIPAGVWLTHFVILSFKMNANEFTSADITISYKDSADKGALPPYSLFKYIPDNDSYVALPSVLDTEAQTITATVTNIASSLYAVGGSPELEGFSTTSWAILTVAVIAIVAVAVLLLTRFKRSLKHV